MKALSYIDERDVENLTLEELAEEGYTVLKSDSYTEPNVEVDAERQNDHTKVILEGRLMSALKKFNPGYDDEIYRLALRQFKILADSPDMMVNNHYLHNLLVGGAKVKTIVNGEDRTITLYPIDFKNWQDNDFLATNQFTVNQGEHERRPDVTIFVNGLPLVTFELKNADNSNVGVREGFAQLGTYKHDVPNYMRYNQILVSSDGINARVGSMTAGIDRFMRWREPRNVELESGTMEIETLIKYMLNPKDLLNIIKNFIIYETDRDQTIQILAAYHQYYMVNKAVERAKQTLANPKDKRIGVVWHTTGSGKSLSMVFFAGIVERELKNPAILVINDRNDLDDQLFDTFSAAHEYLQQTPEHAEDRSEVRDYMSRKSGGIVFSTIQKFSPDFELGETEMPVLTDRNDVIVIADEAHRTQYGLEAKMTDNGIRYGYAKYLRDALPNASFIGFTGTPIDMADKSTTAVFGNYIDVYDITQAIKDHATVKIYYESHVFPLAIKKEDQEKLAKLINESGIDDDPNLPQNERRKREMTRIQTLAGAKSRLQAIAKHFVNHFETRQKSSFGKSIIVENSRTNAVRLYDEIIKLRPEWHDDDLNKGKIKIVMTTNASDGPEVARFKTTKLQRQALQHRMKDNNDELQIVIVVDMWLTGFDVPSLNTMYVDKPMHGHNLIQAIARVNRVFKDKDSGLIVDYIGIAESLNQALRKYSKNDQGQVGINISKALSLLKDKYNIIKNDFLYGVNYKGFDSDDKTIRIKVVSKVADELLSESEDDQQKFLTTVSQAQRLYALVATQKEAQELAPEIAFFGAVKVFLIKIKSNTPGPGKPDIIGVDYRLLQLIDQSIITEPEVDIYKDLGLERPSLDLISEDFLQKVSEMEEKDLAVNLLEKILKAKVKLIQSTNVVQGRKFQEMLENSIKEYNLRGITSEIVIRKLIQMAQEINKEQQKGKDLGLSPEEIAFYDALANREKAVQMLGEETLHKIAHELVKTVRANAGVDWSRRKNVQAKMRMAVKRLLRKYGYPPDFASEAVDNVLEQAERMAANES